MKRNRGRNRRSGGGGHNPNRHYESTGPDVKIRGSAQQIFEKYQQYARDAQSAGDRVAAENYLQHAEHYYRIVASMQPKERPQDMSSNQDDDSDIDSDDDGDSDIEAAESEPSDSKGGDRQQGRRNRRNRRERREPREDNDSSGSDDDPLKVVSEGDSGADQPQEIGKADDAGSDDEKPRRRTYRRKAEASDSDDDAGVRAIIGRGASRKSADKANAEAAEAGD